MPDHPPTPVTDGSEIKDVRLRLLLDQWRTASRQGLMPSRDFIDPNRLGDLMGWLFLYRVERDPLRFLYLLCGPKIVRRVGFDLTGRYVDEHPHPKVRDGVLSILTAVATTGRPHRREVPRRILDRDVTTEAVVLPLAGPGGTLDYLLALQIVDVSGESEG